MVVARPVPRSRRGVLPASAQDGTPTGEYDNIRLSLRPLRKLFGATMADEFGPLALKAVRSEMIASGLCRNQGQHPGRADQEDVPLGGR